MEQAKRAFRRLSLFQEDHDSLACILLVVVQGKLESRNGTFENLVKCTWRRETIIDSNLLLAFSAVA